MPIIEQPTGVPLHWIRDYQACLMGSYGEWWRLRAERAVATDVTFWGDWRDIRVCEEPPVLGNLRLVR